VYLNGLYAEPSQYVKGLKGIKIYHDCDYFKERHLYHKDARYMDKWLNAIQHEAEYIDVTKKYQKIQELGKGKFSTVHLCLCQDSGDYVAMKLIDKKQLTSREREFLKDEI
jgi:serine/threonine protein kinase